MKTKKRMISSVHFVKPSWVTMTTSMMIMATIPVVEAMEIVIITVILLVGVVMVGGDRKNPIHRDMMAIKIITMAMNPLVVLLMMLVGVMIIIITPTNPLVVVRGMMT